MELHPVTSTILIILVIVQALVLTVVFGLIGFGFKKLSDKIEQLTPKIEPVLDKVDQALATTNDKLTTIGDKTEGIIAQGEEVAGNVHDKVDKTATVVQKTVHAPIIALNSFAAGVSRGVETFGKLQRSSEDATSSHSGNSPGAGQPVSEAPQ